MNEISKKEFVHLKIHTQYSICEGALKTLDLAKYCKENKIKAIGLCDTNNLCGALEFSEFIAKSKTQPIIGTQINIKYKDNIGKIPIFAKNLEGYNINVLSPVGSDALNPKDEFIILDEDPVKDHRILQDSIFAKIRSASFHVVANVDGYIGSAAKMEIGYALAYGLQILTIEPVNDPNLSPYCRLITDIFPDALKGIKN